MLRDKNQEAFFELLRAGLWEKEARLLQFNDIDYAAIMDMAEEQSLVGLVTAGLEHVTDVKVPQEMLLQFIGSTLQIEQQNKEMNAFLARLIEKLRKEDVYAVLVKGQGIAQCYEKPLWRSSGDIDLLLNSDNYERAKKVLIPLASEVENEYKTIKHLGMTMEGGFVVELHGTLHSRLSKRIDKQIDAIQNDVFFGGNVRTWDNGGTTVHLPAPNNDVIFVLTHILHHFYIGGVGLRQICDLCRLLWKYRNEIDKAALSFRLDVMGLTSEWKAFAELIVDWLGMPKEVTPLYNENDNENEKFKRKAELIVEFLLESGNFGNGREIIKRPKNIFLGKIQAAWYKMRDFARHARIFPMDSVKFFIL